MYQQQVAKAKFHKRNLKRKERKARRLQHMRISTMASSTSNHCHRVSSSIKSGTYDQIARTSNSMGNGTSDQNTRVSSSIRNSTYNHGNSTFGRMWGTSCFVDDRFSNSVWGTALSITTAAQLLTVCSTPPTVELLAAYTTLPIARFPVLHTTAPLVGLLAVYGVVLLAPQK